MMNNKIIFIILFIGVYLIRLLFLDSDVRCFNLAQIQPIDELYYNEIGIKIYNEGWNILFTGELDNVSIANSKIFLIPNLLSALSFSIFGNNLIGLRFMYVLMGLITGLLLLKCSNRLFVDNPVIIIFIAVAFLFDFNLLMLSRSAVTVVPCMMVTLIYLYIMLFCEKEKVKYALLGGLPIVCFFLMYGNMPFMMFLSFVYLFYCMAIEERKWTKAGVFCIGILLSLLLCEIVDYAIFRCHFWNVFLDTMYAHHGKITQGNEMKIFVLCRHIIQYFMSNMFRYNILFVLFFVYAMVCLIFQWFYKRDRISLIMFLFISFHWLQTIFLDNMTPAKATITYPIILLFIAYHLKNFGKEKMLLMSKSKYYYWIVAAFCLAMIVFVNEKSSKALFPIDRIIIYVISMITIALLYFRLYYNYKSVFYIVFLNVLMMSFLQMRYIYLNKSYGDVEMMKNIGTLLGKEPVINGKGFCLYNTIHSVVDDYDHYKGVGYNEKWVLMKKKDEIEKNDSIYYIAYSSENINDMIESIGCSDVTIELKKKFKRRYTTRFLEYDSDISVYCIKK